MSVLKPSGDPIGQRKPVFWIDNPWTSQSLSFACSCGKSGSFPMFWSRATTTCDTCRRTIPFPGKWDRFVLWTKRLVQWPLIRICFCGRRRWRWQKGCPACYAVGQIQVQKEEEYKRKLNEEKVAQLARLKTLEGCVQWLATKGRESDERDLPHWAAAVETVTASTHTDPPRFVKMLLKRFLEDKGPHCQLLADALRRIVPSFASLEPVLREARAAADRERASWGAIYGDDDFHAVRARAEEQRMWEGVVRFIDELISTCRRV
jgi:hypothetical protein